jgi:hypothetical protein
MFRSLEFPGEFIKMPGPPIQNVAMLQTIERGHAFKNVAMTPYLLVLVFSCRK